MGGTTVTQSREAEMSAMGQSAKNSARALPHFHPRSGPQ